MDKINEIINLETADFNALQGRSEKPPLHRKFGRFKINSYLITESAQELLEGVMHHFLVVRAESLFSEAVIEYTALSALFDPVPEGKIAPFYELSIVNGDVIASRQK